MISASLKFTSSDTEHFSDNQKLHQVIYTKLPAASSRKISESSQNHASAHLSGDIRQKCPKHEETVSHQPSVVARSMALRPSPNLAPRRAVVQA